MIALSDNAKKALEKYLQQVRACLRGCKTVDANEIEQNITEHIENEFAAAAEPVSLSELNIVLERLGSPRQWLPKEELPWWRKTIAHLRTGPDDWRLGYISFALLLLFLYLVRGLNLEGMLLVPILVIVRPPIGIIFWISFLLARTAVREAEAREEQLGALKWLTYPPLLLMYVTSALLILLWPCLYIVPELMGLLEVSIGRPIPPTYETPGSVIFGGLITGIYWAALGAVFLIRPKLLAFLLRPFADKFSRTFARLVLLFGSGITLAFAILFIWWLYA